MKIIDTHAHLDQLADIDGALARAHQAGVAAIVAMSVDLASMRKVLELAAGSHQPKIHPALGVHPGEVRSQDQQSALDFMRVHIGSAVAVGETGLDYWYPWVRKDEAERHKQKVSFQFHLDTAKETDLPVVIHSRGAWRDCLAMTRASGVRRALFHWYSGPVDILMQILEAGYYVSTSPSVAYSPPSRAAMGQAPLERILIETDAPVFYRAAAGQPADFLAEPKDVFRTLKALASLKNIDEQIVLDQVNRNARDFFGIPDLDE